MTGYSTQQMVNIVNNSMDIFLKKTWKIGLTMLFGVAVFFFWGSAYPAHLSY